MNSKRHGQGELEYADGYKFEGQWSYNKPEGKLSSKSCDIIDAVSAEHPGIQKCVTEGRCTSQFTGTTPYPQLGLKAASSDKFYCETCMHSCNAGTPCILLH